MIGSSVSIALTTYNGGTFLPEQLRSLATQTRLADELIVGDDRSTDTTAAIINDFAATAPFPVRLTINDVNLGFGRNFSSTLLRCKSRYIFFCDQDDDWSADKIARCLAVLQASETPAIVTHDAFLTDSRLVQSGLTLCQQFGAAGASDPSDMVYGCCMCFDAFFSIFFTTEQTHSHDTWLAEIGRLLQARIHIDAPLISYRRHDNNATQSHATSLFRTNRAKRLLSRIAQVLRADIRSEVRASHNLTGDLIAAFERNAGEIVRRFGVDRLEAALITLRQRRDMIEARMRILETSRAFRLLRAVGLARSGEYAIGSRLGMIRDLIA